MFLNRRKTKQIMVGNLPIGGDAPISIQSMTNTDTKNIVATVKQIKRLEEAGCDLIRFAVNDLDDAAAIKEIKKRISIPTIADIQYNYKLAVESAKNGIDCVRINPGNIGEKWKVKEVVDICASNNIPIRIGVNSGSISKDILDKYKGVNENSIVESAFEEINVLESLNFTDIKVSLKASNVNLSLAAYRKFSEMSDYPLHIGITEAGPGLSGIIKSSVGIGILLEEGIGDTIRVSLTADPIEEVKAGKEILKSLGLLNKGIEIISCPTCARTKINLIELVEKAQEKLSTVDKNIKIALMGCPVNGPGEAKEADIGITGGNGVGLIFKNGVVIKKVSEENLLDELYKEIENMK
ncbi:flavodoxin-dependent (E)-4-hydroxy-3-methylbut-2-enyl-diphosphate synthase [Peptoniphilus catoniae]|uniref:flavodoxin-dependent (E)-4-hydroxy-3-methylbut-2-enyl-diphosphate synthase n=1 Tax=Peptoniphilus catoniae TaxID=1660341 RepID=UPI0010FF3916|nr:flavodoxin-dependent (E)-4-hydroxy-3-methylbut-2-enyl-diphosphate synthase [Peptoniphilus catoniae]